MVFTLLSWLYIGLISFVYGMAVFSIAYLKKPEKRIGRSPDLVVLTGFMLATVYAQFFSLFGRVGTAANVVLAAVGVILVFLCRKTYVQYFREIKEQTSLFRFLFVLAIAGASIVTILLFDIQGNLHYDTDLYHAQSVRWIEEVGVVPGLGNLHNRFAYNSSFFAAQALFSLKFLVGQSLHSLNGFITVFMLIYAIAGIRSWKKKRVECGDFIRLGIVWYIFYFKYYTTSVCSDNSAMLFVMYIVAGWLDLLSDKEQEEDPYIDLAMLAVFSVTLKLSVAPIALLVIKPVISVLRRKDYRKFGICAGYAFLIVLPFLIRNVIISGYLLYPYSFLDLFPVDWKMPAEVVAYDSKEIMVWGRGLYEVEKADWPIIRWFPNWYNTVLEPEFKWLLWLDFISLGVLFFQSMWMAYKRKWDEILVNGVSVVAFLMWLFTAPLVRYGFAYLILLPAVSLPRLVQIIPKGYLAAGFAVWVVTLNMCYDLNKAGRRQEEYPVYLPMDYSDEFVCEEAGTLAGVTIYTPTEGDRTGYHYFPSTPRLNEGVEARGDNLKMGFRWYYNK